MSTIMQTYNARLTGALVAECPRCHTLCAYWDDDDLDDDKLLCHCDATPDDALWATCRHCQRAIAYDPIDGWVDPEATGDDSIWREVCDEHDTFQAEHEPEEAE